MASDRLADQPVLPVGGHASQRAWSGTPRSARDEWAQNWPLVLGGAMGYAVIGLFSWGLAPFVRSIEGAYGWSRAEVMLGLTIASGLGIVINPLAGMLVDRVGGRLVGLSGQVVLCGGFALLSMTTGTLANWVASWLLISCGVAMVQGMVWTSKVAARFETSRGFAIATVLNGSAVTASFLPLAAIPLIEHFGWRHAIAGVGLIWFAVTFTCTYILFRDPKSDQRGNSTTTPVSSAVTGGVSVAEGLRMPAFWCIAFSMFAFIFYTMALSPNLIALLDEKGASAAAAGHIAALMGVTGFAARMSVGYLLDRLPTKLVASGIFIVPVVGGLILLMNSPSILLLSISVACFGATVGAEFDVLYFLVAKYFGLKRFGSLLGLVSGVGAISGSLAPVIAGWLHDISGNYDLLVMILIGLMAAGAVAMAAMSRPVALPASDQKG